MIYMSYVRHGVEQLRTGWADGPAYVTQCPIAPGGRFTQRFTISGQEGTVWWHAHYSWLRASVHGAFVIYPKRGKSYPFPKPTAEVPIIIGTDDLAVLCLYEIQTQMFVCMPNV